MKLHNSSSLCTVLVTALSAVSPMAGCLTTVSLSLTGVMLSTQGALAAEKYWGGQSGDSWSGNHWAATESGTADSGFQANDDAIFKHAGPDALRVRIDGEETVRTMALWGDIRFDAAAEEASLKVETVQLHGSTFKLSEGVELSAGNLILQNQSALSVEGSLRVENTVQVAGSLTVSGDAAWLSAGKIDFDAEGRMVLEGLMEAHEISGAQADVVSHVQDSQLQLEAGPGYAAQTVLNRLQVGTVIAADASYAIRVNELGLLSTGSYVAGTVETGTLTIGMEAAGSQAGLSPRRGTNDLRNLKVNTIRFLTLMKGEAPLTLHSLSVRDGSGPIGIDLSHGALKAGAGAYSLLTMAGAQTGLLSVERFVVTDAAQQLLENSSLKGVLTAEGQTLVLTLTESNDVSPDVPAPDAPTPDSPTPGGPEPGLPQPDGHQPGASGSYAAQAGRTASANALAGLLLADAANQSETLREARDVKAVQRALDQAIALGDTHAVERLGSQFSGGSAAVLGMAYAAGAQQQLNSIRNRAVAGVPGAAGDAAGCPESRRFAFWVNAEGGYLSLSSDGSASGYSLNSWGGTLGVEMAPRKGLRLGLAFTALFGDLDAQGYDAADGYVDACYLSAFGQLRQSAWSHTVVVSLGASSLAWDRSVETGDNRYVALGDTDGASLGLLYELAYDIPLSRGEEAVVLQPLAYFSYLHTRVDGYTEKGGPAALRYGNQEVDNILLGTGARIRGTVGEGTLNRRLLLEGRALAKFHCGDRRSTAGVGFAHGSTVSSVSSADVGVFGAELGAGLTLPLGSSASDLFADASVELYGSYHQVNATVGYRLRF